jgi:hypothetical protein
MTETFIVKVQRSLFSTGYNAQVLIYDETRTIFVEAPADPRILALFGPREMRMYCRAHLEPGHAHDEQNLILGTRVEDQSW